MRSKQIILVVVIEILLTFREQFYGFLTQFFDVFAELKNNTVYLTGESYAGYYV